MRAKERVELLVKKRQALRFLNLMLAAYKIELFTFQKLKWVMLHRTQSHKDI